MLTTFLHCNTDLENESWEPSGTSELPELAQFVVTDYTPLGLPPIVWDLTNWRASAACNSFDTNIFFPVGTTRNFTAQVKFARTICASCPSQLPCLEFSIRTLQDGIWGGHTEDERRSIRRKRRKDAKFARLSPAEPIPA